MINEDIKNKLKYVKISDNKIDLTQFPDFFIAGPHRTGSTWLYKNIRRHPQIFMSSPKEIFFFSSIRDLNHPRYITNELSWYLKFFSDSLPRLFAKNILCLFNYQEFYKPKVRGEATTTYAVMKEDLIEDVAVINPKIKVIIMIRHPVERAWSHAKWTLVKTAERKFDDITEKEFMEFFHDEYIMSCGLYDKLIKNWTAALTEENVFVGIFDDISKSPNDLLMNVFKFLGVDADYKYMPNIAQKKINVTQQKPIPDRYNELLYDMFKDEIARMNSKFGLNWK